MVDGLLSVQEARALVRAPARSTRIRAIEPGPRERGCQG